LFSAHLAFGAAVGLYKLSPPTKQPFELCQFSCLYFRVFALGILTTEGGKSTNYELSMTAISSSFANGNAVSFQKTFTAEYGLLQQSFTLRENK